ncbi:hypothetical protein AB0H29_16115 [Streptomyces thermolilacinus]
MSLGHTGINGLTRPQDTADSCPRISRTAPHAVDRGTVGDGRTGSRVDVDHIGLRPS